MFHLKLLLILIIATCENYFLRKFFIYTYCINIKIIFSFDNVFTKFQLVSSEPFSIFVAMKSCPGHSVSTGLENLFTCTKQNKRMTCLSFHCQFYVLILLMTNVMSQWLFMKITVDCHS